MNESNKIARLIKTPIGIGFMNGFDPETGKYQVQISKKDCTVPFEGNCTNRFFTPDELKEIEDSNGKT